MLRSTSTIRYLSSSVKVSKDLLLKLRKRTGFAISKCHAALAQHNNNLDEAENWLSAQAEKEGWAKANKLQNRKTAEGLIGIYYKEPYAAMVEVNCETDFVARNENFLNLLNDVALTTYHHGNIATMIRYNSEEIGNLTTHDSQRSLINITAATIGKIGENLILRRGIFVAAPANGILNYYIHSVGKQISSDLNVGKYGAIIASENIDKSQSTSETSKLQQLNLSRQLCQHVVGVNPVRIRRDAARSEIDEDALLDQAFLLDNSVQVGELVERENLRVLDFVRYQCGEVADDID
ncbi:uncharacterized protein TRIADDRAFT_23029 [Trichoplax adhaerens]|uniref:Elongation factor Ts, mitochondrial n=1 Tax=Trichoplax adhaerens TaxID=10228 RepID=B3RRU7_TRIAD|nr:hypothetical protein TRIADDRAFT_23029 [Trichoplax adhaerens]EDV26411.1 hypothetical protein TRIADDRAFT_23029 [Trichoplax adhaerens]|eukprot:XP_002110407.1 hypothetical protein TRIADDRAFT_23029 [Trichoplax adhaerens]